MQNLVHVLCQRSIGGLVQSETFGRQIAGDDAHAVTVQIEAQPLFLAHLTKTLVAAVFVAASQQAVNPTICGLHEGT